MNVLLVFLFVKTIILTFTNVSIASLENQQNTIQLKEKHLQSLIELYQSKIGKIQLGELNEMSKDKFQKQLEYFTNIEKELDELIQVELDTIANAQHMFASKVKSELINENEMANKDRIIKIIDNIQDLYNNYHKIKIHYGRPKDNKRYIAFSELFQQTLLLNSELEKSTTLSSSLDRSFQFLKGLINKFLEMLYIWPGDWLCHRLRCLFQPLTKSLTRKLDLVSL